MALWGNKDNLQGPTPVTIVGTATSEFWTAAATGIGTIATGTTIVLGDGGSAGFAVIEASLGADLVKVNHLSALAGANEAVYSQQPISLKNDPGYAPTSADGSLGRTQRPVGVSSVYMTATAGTVWQPDHTGWVGVTTYMDNSATPPVMRVKKEVMVAMSGIQTGNREYPDMLSRSAAGVVIGGASVSGSATPVALVNSLYSVATPSATAGDLTYVWSTTDGSATIATPTASSTNIGFSTAGNYNVTCTVSSGTASDSPSSDTLAVVAS